MSRTIHRSLLLLMLASGAPLSAQTFIVDRQNGPGTHFTSLTAAIAQVPDGAVLRVRAGTYPESIVIAGKGLTVLGDDGVRFLLPFPGGGVSISGIAAHQSVCISNLSLVPNTNNPASVALSCASSQGSILIERTPALPDSHVDLRVLSCARVVVRDCDLRNSIGWENVHVESSDCVFSNCLIGTSRTGLVQVGGTVQLADCTVTGGTFFLVPPPHAVVTSQGQLRVLGASHLGGGQAVPGGFGFAITGTSNVRLEPTVTLSGSTPPVDPLTPVVIKDMPRVALTTLSGGTQVRADLAGPSGHVGILLFGLPGPVTPVPGIEDPFWLDATNLGVVATGVLTPAVPVSHTLNLSGSPILVGVRLGWQGVSWDPVVGFQLTNPSFQVLR